ncbi:LexA repressor [Paenibacillus sp. KQZ6P-2]|uniref:LexA repressor n=1 Tax=Paenibacillus mangrovi TaxID=2931978 RepID=A0A9X1WV94_9BACL|nr:LexA repressor [Paenibacillus mangrovi]MCJ8015201.1 LexA repressor [Paenibacillus mangrovi]
METLTKRQGEVLVAIDGFIKSHQYPPTVKELSILMGFASTSTTHSLLIQLEKKGYIHREESKPRAMKVLCQT